MTTGCGRVVSAAALSPSTVATSARRAASGDQTNEDTPPLTDVTRSASPPRRSSSHTWPPSLPWREERKASQRPSGLQRGDDSPPGVEVTRTVCEPSQLVIQMSDSDRSFAESIWETVYATQAPSGETCGSRTLRRRYMSVAATGRGAVGCAAGAWGGAVGAGAGGFCARAGGRAATRDAHTRAAGLQRRRVIGTASEEEGDE